MIVKGYIFDYGGTLDTGGCHWGKMLWHAYQHIGMSVSEQQFREAYVHAERTLGKDPIIQPNFTFRQTLEAKIRLQLEYLSQPPSYCSHLTSSIMDDVYAHTAHSHKVLQQIPQPKVLVSNFYGNISTVLQEFSLNDLFFHIIESAVVGVRKPDPRIFTLGVEALGLQPPEVAVVGDSIEKDIIPAKESGCQTIWLRGEQWSDNPVDASAADHIINNLTELITTSKYN